MKRTFILLLFLIKMQIYSQTTWHLFQGDTIVGFQMSATPVHKDTLGTDLYYLLVDSILGHNVLIMENSAINDSLGFFGAALAEESNDTLRAILRLSIALGDFELLSVNNANIGSIHGLEAGLKLNNSDSTNNTLTFLRLYYFDTHFITFVSSSYEYDAARMLDQKDLFFSSIIFKQD